MIALKAIAALFTLTLLVFTISCAAVYNVSYDYNTGIDLGRLKTYDWLRVPEKEGVKDLDVVRIKNAVNAGLRAKGLTQSLDNPDFLVALYIVIREKVNIVRRGYGLHPGYYRYGPFPGYRGYGPYGRYWGSGLYPHHRSFGPYRGYRSYGLFPGYRGRVPHRKYGKYGPQPGYKSYGPYGGYRKYRSNPGHGGYGPFSGLHGYGAYPYYRAYGGVAVTSYEEGTLILDFIDPALNEVIWQGSAKSLVDDSIDTQTREKHINDAVRKILENFPPAT